MALVEGVKATPAVGSLLVAGVAGAGTILKEMLTAPELPEQARAALRQLAEDYLQMLPSLARQHPEDNTLEAALVATLEILTAHMLSAAKLANSANLDPARAAQLTLQRAHEALTRLYDDKARALAGRLVREYYD